MIYLLFLAVCAVFAADLPTGQTPTSSKDVVFGNGKTLHIDSPVFDTTVRFSEVVGLKEPKIRVDGFNSALLQFVTFSSGTLCISEECGDKVDVPVQAANQLNPFSWITLSISAFAALFGFSQNLPKHSLIVLLACLGALNLIDVSVAVDTPVAGAEPRYEINVQLPSDFTFDSLSATMPRGEIQATTRVSAQLMVFHMCAEVEGEASQPNDDGSTSRVEFGAGLSVGESLSVCTTGDAVLRKTRSLADKTSYKIDAGNNVQVEFEGLFGGDVALTPGDTGSVDFRNSDCERGDAKLNTSARGFVGRCGLGNQNQLTVNAVANIVLGFVKSSGTAGQVPGNIPKPAPVPFDVPPRAADNVIRIGAEWSFLVDPESAPSDWMAFDFDDSAWQRGDAPFGYGDDDRGAQYGYPLTPRVSNLYLRHRFSFSAAELAFSNRRRLLVASDDGADIYINGQLLNAGADEDHEARYWNDQFTLDDSKFRDGDNVVAIRVRNGPISSDIYFDAELAVDFNKVEEPPTDAPTPPPVPPTPAANNGGQPTPPPPTPPPPTPPPPTPPQPTPPPVTAPPALPVAPSCGEPKVAPNCHAQYMDPEPMDCAPKSPAISGETNPPLLTAYTERAQYRLPDPALDPNPRDNCPHKQSGLKLWTDPATWGGRVPTANDNEITLPANTKVLVTACTFAKTDVYKKIRVPEGSELIFADADIELHVRGIIVQGALRIGSPTCRLFSNIQIVFHGQKTTDNNYLDKFGDKGIYVPGEIDVHGKQFHPTWSRLSQSVNTGDDRVHLQQPVNWEVGQQVVVVTSIYEDEYTNENEVMTIKAVDGRTVQFTEPLKHHHYGGREYQVEVGLLSRRIEFRGHEADSKDTFFGGHCLITGVGRISGTRAHMMGQRNVLARYPFHFHLANSCPDCFFKDNACHGTFYRCITIHAINEALITRNVGFDIWGSAIYMEDGVEVRNTISYNLMAHVHPIGEVKRGGGQGGQTMSQNCPNAGCQTTGDRDILQPADMAAAPFYISNAYNRYIGNAASGGFAGFSFPNLFKAIGPSSGAPFSPAEAKNLEFDGNTAHSAGYFWSGGGACVYTGGDLQENNNGLFYQTGRKSRNTRDDFVEKKGSASMLFTNLKVFLCNIGVMHWGNRLDIRNYEAIDTARVASLFGESSIYNAVFDAVSQNPTKGYSNRLAQPRQPTGTQFQFYDTGTKTIFDDCIMRNADRPWMSMTHSDKFKPFGMTSLTKIRYENSNTNQLVNHDPNRDTGSTWLFNWIDFDGSMSQEPPTTGGHKIICGSTSGDWWKFHNNCKRKWNNMYCCLTEDKDRDDVARVNFQISGIVPGPNPVHHQSRKLGESCMFGDNVSGERCIPLTDQSGLTGVTGRGWYLAYNDGSPKNLLIRPLQLSSLTYIYVALRYPSGSSFRMWFERDKKDAAIVTSMGALRSASVTTLFFDGTHLFIKLINNNKQYNNDNCYQHDPAFDFARGENGAYLRHYSYCSRWFLEATCATSKTVNGQQFCAGAKRIPTTKFL